MVDRINSLLWTSDSELDHGSSLKKLAVGISKGEEETYLIGAKLVLVLLVGNKCAQLHGEVTISLSLNQWQLPVLNVNLILSLEEIVDSDLLGLRWIGLVLQVEGDRLSITTSLPERLVKHKSLDGILLLQVGCCSSC